MARDAVLCNLKKQQQCVRGKGKSDGGGGLRGGPVQIKAPKQTNAVNLLAIRSLVGVLY